MPLSTCLYQVKRITGKQLKERWRPLLNRLTNEAKGVPLGTQSSPQVAFSPAGSPAVSIPDTSAKAGKPANDKGFSTGLDVAGKSVAAAHASQWWT